jgi:hypothetical protein
VFKRHIIDKTRHQDELNRVCDVNLCSMFEICQSFGFRQPGYGVKFTRLHGIILQKMTIFTRSDENIVSWRMLIHVHRTTISGVRMADTGSNLVQPSEQGQ